MENKTHKGFRVRQEGYRQVIQQRTSWLDLFGRIFASLFMTVWLSGWTVGCVMMIYGLVTNFSWFLLLFSIPFFIGWFAGASFWVASLFGKQELILEKDHLEFVFSVLIPVMRKQIPYEEIVSVDLTTTNRSSAIKIETTGKPMNFGSGYRLEVLEELQEHLLDAIPNASGATKPDLADDPVPLQRRTIKPESSQWHLDAGIGQNETKFLNRGAFQLGAICVLLGFTLFWNGIVGVFLVKVIQAWRGLGDQPASVMETVFLIPFVLVGGVMFLLLLFTFLEPFRQTVYGFSSREIYRQFGYFGFSRTKIWPVMHAVTMELELKTEFEDEPELNDGMNYLLKFNQENEKLMEIGGLTLAEACWIATEIENSQSSYASVLSNAAGVDSMQPLGQQKQ